MIHSLFDSRDQNRDYSNIDYPKENIKTMKKGVMVNGSEVFYGKGKKVPINYNKNISGMSYNRNIERITKTKTTKTKTTYNYSKVVHNNQIKYINREEKVVKEINNKNNTDLKPQKLSIDKEMEITFDDSQPSCFVTVRLYNGDIIKGQFNCNQKFGDVYSFIKRMSRNNNFVLLDGFPPKPLREYGKTISELGIENAVLTQRIN